MRKRLVVMCAVGLAGCSVFIPPHRWDAAARRSEDGTPSCPSYAYPGVDAAFGVPMLALGIAVLIASSHPSSDHPLSGVVDGVAHDYGIIFSVTGAVWTASAIYGFSKNGNCHEQLEQLQTKPVTSPADTGRATPAPPPPAPTPP